MEEKDRKKIYQEKANELNRLALENSGDDRQKLPLWDGIKRAGKEKEMVEAWGTEDFVNQKIKEASSEIIASITGVQDSSPPPPSLETTPPPEGAPVEANLEPTATPEPELPVGLETPPEPMPQDDPMDLRDPVPQEGTGTNNSFLENLKGFSAADDPQGSIEAELPERPASFGDSERDFIPRADMQPQPDTGQLDNGFVRNAGFPNFAAMQFPGISISDINQQFTDTQVTTDESVADELDFLSETAEQTAESMAQTLMRIAEALIYLKQVQDQIHEVLDRSFG